MKTTYEAIAAVPGQDGYPNYARIEVRGRMEWKTKQTAIKHAREYKARHLRDSWAQECYPSRDGSPVMRFAMAELPARADVQMVTFHRNPTQGEIKFGHGATHYKDFDIETACHAGTRILKKWLVCPHDGLRYYR